MNNKTFFVHGKEYSMTDKHQYPWPYKVLDYIIHPFNSYKRWLREHAHYCDWMKARNAKWFEDITPHN